MRTSVLELDGLTGRRREMSASAPAVGFFNGRLQSSGVGDLRNWVAQHAEVPLKACYGGRGAGAWRSIVSSVGYDLGLRERRCLEIFLPHISAQLSSVGTVVHLGSGDGAEVPIVLRQESFHKDLTYVLVDISPDLIDLASDVYCSLREERSLVKISVDLETEEGEDFISAISSDKPRLLMLVANGALLSDPLIWRTLWASMRAIDYAIILLEVTDFSSPESMAHSYRIPSVQWLLRNGLSQIGFSEAETASGYSVQIAEKELKITWTPALKARQRWEAEYGRELARAELVLLRSAKPAYNDFRESLVGGGFDICKSLNHAGTRCAGFLVRQSS
jgi:hypothetical protein